tara:strand:- start:3828 stop:4088 length:261 start_codon:yes stop_codon:yes gene_type:complete
MQVKYFSKDLLVKANKAAIRTNRNRSLEPKFLTKLDEDNKYPIVWATPHNDVEMRVRLLLDAKSEAWLDIPFKTYDKLPVVTMPTH